LAIFLLHAVTSCAQEALVLVGGKYPDGYDDTEVEVWSLSAECGVHIKNTPDSFVDRPAVAVLDRSLYVCGGSRIGSNRTSSACDIYSLTDNQWTEGASLKFNQSIGHDDFNVDGDGLRLAAVGSTLVAVYRKSPDYEKKTYFQMSTLSESGWSEPIYLNVSMNTGTDRTEDVIAVDDGHLALSTWTDEVTHDPEHVTYKRNVHIVNIETASVVGEVSTSWDHWTSDSTFKWYLPFLFNGKYTCVANSSVWSLTFDQDFTNHTWNLVEILPADFAIYDTSSFLADVGGVLTIVMEFTARVIYFTDGGWKSGELEIPRKDAGYAVVPCN